MRRRSTCLPWHRSCSPATRRHGSSEPTCSLRWGALRCAHGPGPTCTYTYTYTCTLTCTTPSQVAPRCRKPACRATWSRVSSRVYLCVCACLCVCVCCVMLCAVMTATTAKQEAARELTAVVTTAPMEAAVHALLGKVCKKLVRCLLLSACACTSTSCPFNRTHGVVVRCTMCVTMLTGAA